MNNRMAVTPSVLSFALSFLLVGAGFALPFYLFPVGTAGPTGRAPEVLNLFCLVSWLGMSHFYFAYRGHFKSFHGRPSNGIIYFVVLAVSMAVLAGLWNALGAKLFSALAWSYFVAHMIKAEMFFVGLQGWRHFFQPLLGFVFFSFALLAPDEWVSPATLFAGAALACAPFLFPGFRDRLKVPLFGILVVISAFLVGEGLLWGRYRPWMTPEFRDGVYTVHVALFSFFHYFRSYAHMQVRGQGKLRSVFIVNAVVIALGLCTLFLWAQTPLIYVFGFQYFTFWVWLHQWMSDVFNALKRVGVTNVASPRP